MLRRITSFRAASYRFKSQYRTEYVCHRFAFRTDDQLDYGLFVTSQEREAVEVIPLQQT